MNSENTLSQCLLFDFLLDETPKVETVKSDIISSVLVLDNKRIEKYKFYNLKEYQSDIEQEGLEKTCMTFLVLDF